MSDFYELRTSIEKDFRHPDQEFQDYFRQGNGEGIWVDLGCGTNRYVEEYRGQFKQAFGIDVDLRLVGRAAKPFIVSDSGRLCLKKNSVDLVSTFMVVEHWVSPVASLQEIMEVLKPGGIFVCCTVNKTYWASLLNRALPEIVKRWIVRSVHNKDDEDIFKAYYRFNDQATIKQIIAEIGFDQLEIKDYVEYVYLSKFLFKLQRFLHKGTFLGNTALLKSHFLIVARK